MRKLLDGGLEGTGRFGSGVVALAGALGLALLFAWEHGMVHVLCADADSAWANAFYLALACGLVPCALASGMRGGRAPRPTATMALDALSGLAMALGAGVLALGAGGFGQGLAAAGLGGLGASWAFVRWGCAFARLEVRRSIVWVCCSLVVAAPLKAVFALASATGAAVLAASSAVLVVLFLGLVERGVRGGSLRGATARDASGDGRCACETRRCAEDAARGASVAGGRCEGGAAGHAGLADGQGEGGAAERTPFRRFMLLCFGVSSFSFTLGLAQATLSVGAPSARAAVAQAVLEAVLALGLVVWVAMLKRRLSFTWSWRALLVFMAVILAFVPYASLGWGGSGALGALLPLTGGDGVREVAAALARTVRSIIVGLWFLALADIVRRSRLGAMSAFACGWCAYALASALGAILGDALMAASVAATLLLSAAVPALIAIASLVDEVALCGAALFEDEAGQKRRGAQAVREASVDGAQGAVGGTGAPQACGASGTGGEPPRACGTAGGGEGKGEPAPEQAPCEVRRRGADRLPAGASTVPPRSQLSLRCDLFAARTGLTAREREVLELLMRGRTGAYIAETLVISENTARGHVRRLYTKLGVHSRQELIDLVERA